MEPYREMYYKLFNATSKAIEVLQEIQKEVEELYISVDENSIMVFHEKENYPTVDEITE